jgi:cell division protein FtsX
MCIASFLVYVGITVVGFLFAMSWFLIGYLLKLRHSDREERKINVARSVGSRLTYMSRNNTRIAMFVCTTVLYEYMNSLRNNVCNLFINTHV